MTLRLLKREAESMKREALVEAKDEVLKMKQDAERESKERMKAVRSSENHLNQREQSLDKRTEALDHREHQISSLQGQVDRRAKDVERAEAEVAIRLEEVAGLTAEEAKTELLDGLKEECVHESASIIRDSEARTRAEADKKAREILSVAIQRLAADHTSQITVSTIHIPSDDLKGRIIGREGRNIRSFEQITGTNLIIDDTPECVTVSTHDPVRREIASVTMQNLIRDVFILLVLKRCSIKLKSTLISRLKKLLLRQPSIPAFMTLIPNWKRFLVDCATVLPMARMS